MRNHLQGVFLCYPQGPFCQWQYWWTQSYFLSSPCFTSSSTTWEQSSTGPCVPHSHPFPPTLLFAHCALPLCPPLCSSVTEVGSHSGPSLAVFLAWKALPQMAAGLTPFLQVSVQMFHQKVLTALAGVAQWTECRPANQKVAGSIPSQGPCLGCRPGPQLGVLEGQPHIDVSVPLSFLSPLSKINK